MEEKPQLDDISEEKDEDDKMELDEQQKDTRPPRHDTNGVPFIEGPTDQKPNRKTTGNKRILAPALLGEKSEFSSAYEGGGKRAAVAGDLESQSQPPPQIRLTNQNPTYGGAPVSTDPEMEQVPEE